MGDDDGEDNHVTEDGINHERPGGGWGQEAGT